MDCISVYITCKNVEESVTIAKILVENRLAACANIQENIRSIYQWEGRLEDSQESLLVLKTKSHLFKELMETVKKYHSYSVPCILKMPILDGNPDYLEWVIQGTK